MGKFEDLTGQTFGRLHVLKRVANVGRKVAYECECSCPDHTIFTVISTSLKTGNTRSCGCLNREQIRSVGRGKLNDLSGKKFGHLTVLRRCGTNRFGHVLYECECDCENHTKCVVAGLHLSSGHTTSCGCYHTQRLSEAATKWKTELEKIAAVRYHGMKQRCYNKNHHKYPSYGARGIYICDEWMDPVDGEEKFVKWAISTGFKPELWIERINNDGPYSPENCRWATKLEQANNKRTNCFIDINGERHSLADWVRMANLDYGRMQSLLKKQGYDMFKDVILYNLSLNHK